MIQQSPAKTKSFLNAINKAAMQKCNDIQNQIEETTRMEMQRAKDEARRDGHLRINAEKAKIEAQAKMQIAQYENEKKSHIYAKRKAYQTEVFEQAKAALKDYTKTDAYKQFLKACLADLSDKVGKTPTFNVAEGDAAAKAEITALYPKATVQTDRSVEIGGYRVLESEKGILIDETLDARLLEQLDWFLLNSHLKIEL